MKPHRKLIVLLVPFLASCGAAKNSTDVGNQNEGEIKLFDFDGYSTAATPGATVGVDPSKISNLTTTFGSGGGSVGFSTSGHATSFSFSSRSSSMNASGRSRSFQLNSSSSAFSASAPTASSGGASFGLSSGSCDWEAAVRSLFNSIYSRSETASSEAEAASRESMISGLRPYLASADSRVVCLVAGLYTCLADSFRATDASLAGLGTCFTNVCYDVTGGSPQCSTIATSFASAGS